MEGPQFSQLTEQLITHLERKEKTQYDRKITVNPIVSKFAAWYERLRNAMEFREDEVILRAAIERILKRRLLLGGDASTTAEPLVRELMWARYLPEGVAESVVAKVKETIHLYLQLRLKTLGNLPEFTLNEWTYQLMSSAIEHIINPDPVRQTVGNYMFQLLKDQVVIEDDTEETRNAQVFIAIRKSFARDDVAFLRYHLFEQYFGKLTPENIDDVSSRFSQGYREVIKQLQYPKKERIFSFIKKQTAAFLILEDILREHKDRIGTFLTNKEELEQAVFAACDIRYRSIAAKVQRAIVRSVIFIFLTKFLFAIAIEGTYERIMFGRIMWFSIGLNTGIPPMLMIIAGLFIKTPDQSNSKRVLSYIETVLHVDKPALGNALVVKKAVEKKGFLNEVFTILWLLAFLLSFGLVIFALTKLHFNIVSQFIFVFFLAIVSFLSYRISLAAHLYSLGERQGLLTPVIDFLFLPVIRVGRHLTEGISQINILIFIFDLIIETPFKVLFGFFEQWFVFLHAKRDELE